MKKLINKIIDKISNIMVYLYGLYYINICFTTDGSFYNDNTIYYRREDALVFKVTPYNDLYIYKLNYH